MSAGGPHRAATVHATAVVIGTAGVLIRGPSGSGKSTLAHALIADARRSGRLGAFVSDDRVALSAAGGRLLARAPDAIAGLAELAGRGIVAVDHEAAAAIALVVDIVPAGSLARMPEEASTAESVEGVTLPRQAVEARSIEHARLLVATALAAVPAGPERNRPPVSVHFTS
ncbi:MAG TPA: HPr kinase/phosphatase C-terminal domain-containing protein [Methylomirabilota bacterium]|nr:HPr kinase/phosphatase C-terminal domain-containing protein [Methylomirabilota bacterium]